MGAAGNTGDERKEYAIEDFKYDSNGLIPAIIQDDANGEVLMLAYMNQESLRRTLEEGKTCFWSRSRREFWVKGMTSGHFQMVKSIAYDCDRDCLLIRVDQVGAACHTGERSCFYRLVKCKGIEQSTKNKVQTKHKDQRTKDQK